MTNGKRTPDIRRNKPDRRYHDRRDHGTRRQDTLCLKCKKELTLEDISLICSECNVDVA